MWCFLSVYTVLKKTKKFLFILVFAYSYINISKLDLSKHCQVELYYSVLLIEKQISVFHGNLKQVTLISLLTFKELFSS